MTEQPTPAVVVDVRDHIARLTFARAEAANTFNAETGRAFRAASDVIASDPSVRAVILSGQGRHFCFGGDLKAMVTAGADVQSYLTALTDDLHAGLARLAALSAPVIAAVNGTAAGAGLGIVLAADLAIAARSAKFAPAYTGVALTPDAGCTFLLPRAVGSKRAREMFLTNRVLDAEEALSWGLVNQVVEDADLSASALALAERLAAGPVGAFAAVKRLLAQSEPGFEPQMAREGASIAARAATEEGREGIAAFLAKRVPRY